jgi:hypothetical protein
MTNQLFIEISEWKLEAKQEDVGRYFYHSNITDKLVNGSRSYVIGRKGSGKTAICEHINRIKDPKIFTRKLTFKNFPFNDLYALKNDSYSKPNQYITLWKYLIYTSIAKQMMINANIDSIVREKLTKVYSDDPERSLSRSIKKWVGANLNLEIFGVGGGVGVDFDCKENSSSWIERVETLEDLIRDHVDDSKYLIVFDELDEDYKDILTAEKHKEYTALLTSLFKAVQDIKSLFPAGEYSIFPIIFLRDDIYEIVSDPDKNKWSDFVAEIFWDTTEIKNLLAFRISRSLSPNNEIYDFEKAWNLVFDNKPVQYGHRQQKKMTKFDYMLRSSMMRPRDFVRFLKDCTQKAIKQKSKKATSNIVLKSDDSFSNYLRSELEDEIHSVIPDISTIFDLISHIRKQTIPIHEFNNAFNKAYEEGLIKQKNIDFVLRVLFHFSVIGNQPKQRNKQIFRYKMNDARFNTSEPIVIHRGLYKALQII